LHQLDARSGKLHKWPVWYVIVKMQMR
jgi:hypothetical protein